MGGVVDIIPMARTSKTHSEMCFSTPLPVRFARERLTPRHQDNCRSRIDIPGDSCPLPTGVWLVCRQRDNLCTGLLVHFRVSLQLEWFSYVTYFCCLNVARETEVTMRNRQKHMLAPCPYSVPHKDTLLTVADARLSHNCYIFAM